MVVGYPSGSSPDMLAQMVAEPLAKALGQPVVVENKPGASGNIGADLVAKATDGNTIGVIGNGPMTSSKLLSSKLPYDPNADFAPIALIANAPLVWVTAKPAVERSVEAFWGSSTKQKEKKKAFLTYSEKGGLRAAVLVKLGETVRSHYDQSDRIADDVARLGYDSAAEILRAFLPQSKRARSGDTAC